MKKRLLFFVLAFALLFGTSVLANEEVKVQNPGFEEISAGEPTFWSQIFYEKESGFTTYSIDKKIFHSGSVSAVINNTKGNHARYAQTIKVEPSTYYKLSCWIKTENVGTDAIGANISVEDVNDRSNDITGTSGGWRQVILYGITLDDQTSLNLTVGIGGYSSENTGKAWFDDVSAEKLENLPVGAKQVTFGNASSTTTEVEKPQSSEQENSNTYNTLMLIYSMLFLAAVCIIYMQIKRGKIKTKRGMIILGVLLACGFIFRIIIAPMIEGWPNDISANKSWAMSAANNLTNIYSGWVDYPPFFMYIFFIVGKISAFLGQGQISTLLIKMPSIIADLATAYMLFKMAKKHLGMEMGLLAAAVYAFNPVVFLDSTIWGQVDSFFTMIIVAALMLLMNRKTKLATVLFVVAVLMKPQGIFFFPIIVFELLFVVLIKQKNIKEFFLSILYGIGTLILVILPFSFNKSPLWIVDLYMKTAGEYTSAEMNAFNFWGLIGGNFKDATTNTFLNLSYNTWGIIFVILILGFCGFIYWKSKHIATPIFVGIILNAGAFIFATKMHERYMFPVIALLIMAFIYMKDKRIFILMAGFGATVFFNIQMLFARMLAVPVDRITESYYPQVYGWTIFFALVNIIMFGYLIWLTWDIYIREKTHLIDFGQKPSGNIGAKKGGAKSISSGGNNSRNNQNNQRNQSNQRNQNVQNGQKPEGDILSDISEENESNTTKSGFKISKLVLNKKDLLIMCVMTVIYLAIALINLGSLSAPQTSWQPMTVGDAFTVDLGSKVQLSRVYYYTGVLETKYNSNKYRLEYQDDKGDFKPLISIEEGADDNKWKYTLVNQTTSKVKVIVDVAGGTLNELAFVETGKTTPIENVKIIDKSPYLDDFGDISNLFDEQSTLEYNPSFMTSTYFDEIYHARTAYEYLHGMEPYENTHPPLGKLLIAIGVALLGMNPFGWRIVGTLFGAMMIPLMYMFGKKMFDKSFYGFCAAFLMMFDFMHFTQTRIATVDVYGTFFIILMYYYMYDYFVNKSYEVGFMRSLKPLFLSGLFFGIGAACKWIALYGAGGLALLLFIKMTMEYMDYSKATKLLNAKNSIKRKAAKTYTWTKNFIAQNIVATLLACVLFFVIIPGGIYLASYVPYMNTNGGGHTVDEVISQQKGMYEYHSKSVLNATHPFASRWYTWPLDSRPVWYYGGDDVESGKISSIVAFGNPAIWWGGLIAVFVALGLAIRRREKKLAVIFVAMAFQYLPWVIITRLEFIYHFFSTVPFMMLAIVYVIKCAIEKYENAKYVVYVYLGIVALLFVLFYPVISGMTVDSGYLRSLQWLKSWPGFS